MSDFGTACPGKIMDSNFMFNYRFCIQYVSTANSAKKKKNVCVDMEVEPMVTVKKMFLLIILFCRFF